MLGRQRSWYAVGKGRASAAGRALVDPSIYRNGIATMEVATFMDVSVNESVTLMVNIPS